MSKRTGTHNISLKYLKYLCSLPGHEITSRVVEAKIRAFSKPSNRILIYVIGEMHAFRIPFVISSSDNLQVRGSEELLIKGTLQSPLNSIFGFFVLSASTAFT